MILLSMILSKISLRWADVKIMDSKIMGEPHAPEYGKCVLQDFETYNSRL